MSSNSPAWILAASLSLFCICGVCNAAGGAKSPKSISWMSRAAGPRFQTPAGQSLLIDTGWPDFDGRDADRIVAAAKTPGSEN